MATEKAERNAAIRLAYARGLGYSTIGKQHGISAARVRQIVDVEAYHDRRRERRRRRAERLAITTAPATQTGGGRT